MSITAFVITVLFTVVAIIAAYQGSRLHDKAEKLMATEPSIAVLTLNLTHGVISLSLALVLLIWLWFAEQDEKFAPTGPLVLFFFWDVMLMGFLIRWCVMTRKAICMRLNGECPKIPCRSCPVREGKVHIESKE